MTAHLSLALLLLISSCGFVTDKTGVLHVKASGQGSYELYKSVNDLTYQFVSEQLGKFNEDLKLTPGNYLILGDCSHKTITIKAQEKTTVLAHKVEFIHSHPPQMGDLFSVQCSKEDDDHLRHTMTNQFIFYMLGEVSDLSVGMKSLRVEFPKTNPSDEPLHLKYDLASVRVTGLTKKDPPDPYFVSPADNTQSLTQHQTINNSVFLLPGNYEISLNGTAQVVRLDAKQNLNIRLSEVTFKAPPQVNPKAYEDVRGRPISILINGNHQWVVDETYPVLPGDIKVSIEQSHFQRTIPVEPESSKNIRLKSITVASGCAFWEWECLGKKEVLLFEKEQPYPFMESVTDIPIMYQEEHIYVAMEGMKDLRLRVADHTEDLRISLGTLKFIPVPQHRAGLITDLVRLEALDPGFVGHSGDITPDQPSTMKIMAGKYTLKKFITTLTSEGSRSITSQVLEIKPGKLLEVKVPFFVSEKKFKALSSKYEALGVERPLTSKQVDHYFFERF